MCAFPVEGGTFGPYQIVRRLGRGGMGSVFEARQPDLDRSVALKVLNSELAEDPGFRQRFMREGRILARLSSPHVIQVHEAGELDGELYIATQLVRGRDLNQAISQDGPLPPERALEVAAQIASALDDAHEVGLLHRDVKPGNVLLHEARGEVFAYLCDFGIARMADTVETQTVGVLGTLRYMAPECHQGGPASVESDVYSLGCVLWAALTGRAPYERTNGFQLGLAHVNEPVPVFVGTTPAREAINEVLRRSLAKDPRDRFATAGEMRRALVAAQAAARGVGPGGVGPGGAAPTSLRVAPPTDATVLRGQAPPSVQHPPPSPPKRRRSGALAVGVLGLALVLGAAGGAYALLAQDDDAPSASSGASASSSPSPRTERSAPAAKVPAAEGDGRVACWNGGSAEAAALCPRPFGRTGMETVFPSMDEACVSSNDGSVTGRAEAYECDYNDYLIRYERWQPGYDKYGYFDTLFAGRFRTGIWNAEGEVGGRLWTVVPDGSDGTGGGVQWQRVCAYRAAPYSFTVEAYDASKRLEAIARVLQRIKAPSRIGLP